jgi:uncharacterized protein
VLHESSYIWVAPLTAMIAAQILKPIIIMIQLRRFDWQSMRQSGGMPSSHTALVVALVTELCLREGARDPVLGIGGFVALVVMYDAAGVRWQTGRHAAVLNRMLHDLRGRHTDRSRSVNDTETTRQIPKIHHIKVAKAPWWLVDWPVLNEHVGHKPIEVLGGCIVGVVIALILH